MFYVFSHTKRLIIIIVPVRHVRSGRGGVTDRVYATNVIVIGVCMKQQEQCERNGAIYYFNWPLCDRLVIVVFLMKI